MTFLYWLLNAFMALGAVACLIFFTVGFFACLNAWKTSLLLWQAKRKWLAIERQEAGFKAHFDKTTNNQNE